MVRPTWGYADITLDTIVSIHTPQRLAVLVTDDLPSYCVDRIILFTAVLIRTSRRVSENPVADNAFQHVNLLSYD